MLEYQIFENTLQAQSKENKSNEITTLIKNLTGSEIGVEIRSIHLQPLSNIFRTI